MSNIDDKVVEDFGNEWSTYDQSALSDQDIKKAFNQYFDIFPFKDLGDDVKGFDMGCGSGRWAKFVAPKVKHLNCIEPSKKAIKVAKTRLSHLENIDFYQASADNISIEKSSQDFGYCLGVLHHIPNTAEGIKSCASLLKIGAPFLLYLYYNFENKPLWFKTIWKLTDLIRGAVCKMPFTIKRVICFMIAVIIYLPVARFAMLFEKIGFNIDNFPLSDYRNKPFYFLKTDALDRFGTRLEQRFSKKDITIMLEEAGFERISFSDKTPHWVSLAYKKK
ncbi:MAG: class I SAM-dependent methyltransferase [SAR86 cluster bacterium]|jgi:ubiquinone/menaquinone biosynthesis C-methylase UbiE|nr:class I SAM-dependent methyltransferase [SAR86 cluster bacterium]|tara:strand:+ start:6938 stop:7768 length:831 start_codon:yes stop_codon:yes gene_type:complete